METIKQIDTEVVAQKQETASVEQFITKAIETNVPVETLERLFELRKQVKAEQAKEAFDTAMSNFQGMCPIIEKTKQVKNASGALLYSYAPLEAIVSQAKDSIKSNGFSYAIQTETGENKVKVTCIVKHELGHSEPSSVEVPIGTKTNIMSAPQVVASALTFAKRYAFCNAFGILTGDEDTDARDVGDKTSSKTVDSLPLKKAKIMFLLKKLGYNSEVKEEKLSTITKLTQLEANNENTDEILLRLSVLVNEQVHANS